MIGKTLAHYEIIGTLGAGGMGEVYRARDTKLDREVALKVLPSALTDDLERRKRFIREAKTLAGLKHPNIVTVYSVEEAGEALFITMELVEGRDLGNVIPEGGLPLQELLKVANPLADAVSHAHAQGITHRDLKPANIVLDEAGRPKVLDFGLAKLLAPDPTQDGATVLAGDSVTAEGQVLGTVAYMSPEQAEGKPVDARSDIFSLGIVLYEMATGQRPFKGDTSISTISSILKDHPPPVTELNRSLPRHLGRIIDRCLAKDPDRRYQVALDLRNELEGLEAETASTGPRTIRSRSPRPFLIGGAIVLLIVLGILRPWAHRPGSNRGTTIAGGEDSVPADADAMDGRTMMVVLPFENLGPREDAYFAAGISQEITSRLATLPGLALISRTSARRYAETRKTIREIGAELGVDYVVEGSVQWQKRADGPDRVRITPQLVRVSDDTEVWTQQYEREMEDIFAIQSDIAGEVAGQLGIALAAGSENEGASGPPTQNMEAYQLYLKARDRLESYSLDSEVFEIADTLERAVALDPEFIEAWSLLSMVHSHLYHEYTDRTEKRLILAREAADRVFSIVPDHPQGYIAFGYYYYWGRKDYERALEAFSKTGTLQESDSHVVSAVGYIRRRQGRWDEALERLQTAVRLDPRDPTITAEVAGTLWRMRRYHEADEWIDRAILLAPMVAFYYQQKALNHVLMTGDGVAAEAIAQKAPTHEGRLWNLGLSWYRFLAEKYEAALAIVAGDTLEVYEDPGYLYPKSLWMALVSWGMGNEARTRQLAEESLTYLEKRVENESQDPRLRLALAQTYALLGRTSEALREGRMAIDIFPLSRDAVRGYQYQIRLAETYALCGETEATLDLLEKLLALPGELSPALVEADPTYRSLRGNPRFQALVAGAS